MKGYGKVFIRQCGVDDLVAMLGQVHRLDAARHRLPAAEEKDFHSNIVALKEARAVVPA
jgi:hypothetical protein